MNSTPIPSDRINQLVMHRFKDKAWPDNTHEEQDRFCADLNTVFHNKEAFVFTKFQDYSISTILHYLKSTHHFYLNKRLSEIELSISHLIKDLPEQNYWISSLSSFFKSYEIELSEHIIDEEKNLFPYIEALLTAQKDKKIHFLFSQKIQLINFLLHHDHQVEDNLRQLIKVLKKKYKQFDNSFSFRMLLIQLETLELDLTIHARMEEEVLMPMALQLEKESLKNSSFNQTL